MALRVLACVSIVALCACGGSGSSGSAAPLPPATVTNLGVFATEIEGSAELLATSVREDLQGADLNADGDRDDELLYVYDSTRGQLVATELESDGRSVVADERFLAFLAREKDVDLNGDGDVDDSVLHVYEPSLGTSVDLGVAVLEPVGFTPVLALEGELLAAPVDEAAQAQDLNGDGDLADDVVEVFRPGTGERWNTALASPSVALDSGWVILSLDEAGQETDFSGEGDQDDQVIAFYDVTTGALHVTGLAGVFGAFGVLSAGGVFGIDAAESNGDLNGDGDPFDFVPFTYAPATEELRLVPLDASVLGGHDGRFGLAVRESGVDLNGDGDRDDQVAFVYEPHAGALLPTGLALGQPFDWAGFVGANLLVFCPEAAQGRDLNGDGDLDDSVLQLVDAAGGVRNTGVAGQIRDLRGDTLFLSRDEVAERHDWNGDGRLDSALFAYEGATAALTNLRMSEAELVQVRGPRALVRVYEGNVGADLNGDGDRDDLIFMLQDLASGRRANTGLGQPDVDDARATADGRFLLSVWELQEGRDLNGDGDLDDYWLHVVE